MLKIRFAVVFILLSALVWPSSARAQYTLPTRLGAARMPDPLPVKPKKPLPPLMPGPLTSYQAPPGPKDDLSLPSNHTSAFQCEVCPPEKAVYFHVGVLSLQRQRPGNALLVFNDASNPDGFDTGNGVVIGNIGVVQDLNDITTSQDIGGTATLGILFGDYSVELTGFYIPQGGDGISSVGNGTLNTFFTNAPLGFVGNNGLFRNVDIVDSEIKTAVGSLELNARYHSQGYKHIEPILGVRYLDLNDQFTMFVDDDSVSFPVARNPLRVARYSSIVDNRILGPQLGVELQNNIVPGVAIGAYGKVMLGANASEVRIRLTRGDALEGLPNTGRDRVVFSQVYEAGLNLDVYVLERFRLRAGYQVLWASNVLEATDQVDFDLSNPTGRVDNTGNIFFHGPRVEFQFLF